MARSRTRDGALAEQLLRSAVAIVEGGQTVTTRRVAEAAGTNIAALDQLFGGKSGLVRAVALDGFAQLAREFRLAEAAADPGDRLRAMARSHREFVREHPQLFDLMVSAPVRGSDARREEDLDGALACRDMVVEAVGSLVGGLEERVYEAAVGLTAVLEGLAVKERQGLLGSSRQDCDRIWASTVDTHLAGLAHTSLST